MALEQEYANAYNLINQQVQQNNAWSAQMAANNMQFQMDMANTAHQREVQDLKAAGLNPILSAHGNGAPVGSGAMASPDTNNTAALTSLLKDLIASNTTIGVANAKAAGGGFGYGSGYGSKNDDSGSSAAAEDDQDTPTGFYSLDEKGGATFLNDVFKALTGMSFREAVYKGTQELKDQYKRAYDYDTFQKIYNGDKPAVTTAKGNVEYGAKPTGTVLQWLMNPFSTAVNNAKKRRK